ncbi:DUF1566 domain-containing protein [bacterium]|nr:DUF1566 domain-containing protein [bacterium]
MKQKFLFSLLLGITAVFLFSCGDNSKKIKPSDNSDSEAEAIAQICEKHEAECGELTVKINDSYDKINCGKCKTGFVCDDATNKCKSENDTDEPQDDTDDPTDDTDEPDDDADTLPDEIPESELPVCSSAHSTPCKDAQSGLIWSDKALFAMNREDAADYCATLTDGGYTDWRLPDIDELRTLIMNCQGTMPSGQCRVSERTECLADTCVSDECRCGNDTKGKYSKFGDIEGFWSSSKYSDDTSWGVLFLNAGVRHAANTNEFFIRCVRGENSTVYTNPDIPADEEPDPCNPNPCGSVLYSTGECFPEGSTYVCACIESTWDGSNCVTFDLPECAYLDEPVFPCMNESYSDLIWSSWNGEEATWQEALLYCKNLDEGGLQNWRLPDIDELRTIFNGSEECEVNGDCLSFNECRTDACCSGECADLSCYPGNPENSNYSGLDLRETLWSSSSNQDDYSYAWLIDFTLGDINVAQKTDKKPFRCVWSNRYVNSCEPNFFWNGTKCVPGRKVSKCYGIPQHAEGAEYIIQTWNGTEWLPSVWAHYGGEPGECAFKCKENYTWNGTKCVAYDFASFPECSKTSAFPCKDSSTGTVWSSITSGKMKVTEAISYCETMNEGGYTDWKLANIDELRTLVENSPKTETGGICSVSELEGGCLANYSECYNEDCFNMDLTMEDLYKFSKLGDKVTLWSSSYDRDYAEKWSIYEYFALEFESGSIRFEGDHDAKNYARCVR